MCTAITYKTDRLYFGRTLDHTCSYGECVIICPRNFSIPFRFCGMSDTHPAIIGIGTVKDGYPLYYDAVNEAGLCAAALNFTESAVYFPAKSDRLNLTHFEIIPFILSHCENLSQAKKILCTLNITPDSFSREIAASHLHWIISDKSDSIVIESTSEGLHVYKNPIGILTNEPPFEEQLRIFTTRNTDGFSQDSPSRFIHAYNAREEAYDSDEIGDTENFFRIMSRVSRIGGRRKQKTVYTSCADTEKLIYYYTSYGNRSITAVKLRQDIEAERKLSVFPLKTESKITMQN